MRFILCYKLSGISLLCVSSGDKIMDEITFRLISFAIFARYNRKGDGS